MRNSPWPHLSEIISEEIRDLTANNIGQTLWRHWGNWKDIRKLLWETGETLGRNWADISHSLNVRLFGFLIHDKTFGIPPVTLDFLAFSCKIRLFWFSYLIKEIDGIMVEGEEKSSY